MVRLSAPGATPTRFCQVGRDFLGEPWQPKDLENHEIDVSDLRTKLLRSRGIKNPILVTVRGTLYPCALLSPGWWDRQDEYRECSPKWNDSLQKWLFNGFDLWGPSWDFSWELERDRKDKKEPYYIAQLGGGDEADSLPVMVPLEKADKLRGEFLSGWGGLEVKVTGLLGHRRQFSQTPLKVDLVGGLLDYCIWLREGDHRHKISLLVDETEMYSGYLWKCVAPRKWLDVKKALSLNDVYFIWEHTNFADKEAVKYNLDSLVHKERYITKMHGDLVLLQKASPLVPGQPEWSAQRFYDVLMGKKTRDI